MSSAEIMEKSVKDVATHRVQPPVTVESTRPSTRAGVPLVRLDSISRAFGAVVALNGVSLEVQRGEIFGIIGRSGAGKSTLIRTINGLEQIDAGRIIVDGSDLSALDEKGLNRVRHKIGMIFQHFNLLSMKTVFENVELPLKLAGQARHARLNAVWQLLDMAHRLRAQIVPGQRGRDGWHWAGVFTYRNG
jgi:D-methionine transport system ATP-binding protein